MYLAVDPDRSGQPQMELQSSTFDSYGSESNVIQTGKVSNLRPCTERA